jgi:hypothetical protein
MKRRWIMVAPIAAVFGAAMAVLLSGPREPRYSGHLMSEWLQVIESGSYPASNHIAVRHAVREFDSNAVPWLLHELDAKDFELGRFFGEMHQLITGKRHDRRSDTVRRRQAIVGFQLLGPKGRAAMPLFIQRLQDSDRAGEAAEALAGICGASVSWGNEPGGVNPINLLLEPAEQSLAAQTGRAQLRTEALSHLARAITNEPWEIRRAAIAGMSQFEEDAAVVVPLLIARLSDRVGLIRMLAAQSLGLIAREPDLAIPALMAALSDPQDGVRAAAAEAMSKYCNDRGASNAVPSLQRLLADPDRRVRDAAQRALSKIAPQAMDPQNESE